MVMLHLNDRRHWEFRGRYCMMELNSYDLEHPASNYQYPLDLVAGWRDEEKRQEWRRRATAIYAWEAAGLMIEEDRAIRAWNALCQLCDALPADDFSDDMPGLQWICTQWRL